LSFLTVILCGLLSHLRYQRNPRSKLSVAAEPRWVNPRLPPEDRHLACLGRWASCPSIPTGWKPIFRDSLEGYPPKTKIPDVDVASGKLIVESLGKSKVEEKVLNQSRQQLFRNL